MKNYLILILFFVLSCTREQDDALLAYRHVVESYDNQQEKQLLQEMAKLCEKDILAACAVAGVKQADYPHQLSIIQGATNGHSTQLNILIKRKFQKRLSAHLWQGNKLIKKNIQFFSWYGQKNSPYIVADLKLHQLKADQKYRLDFLLDQKELVDVRTFSLLPEKPKTIRIALASCLDDSYSIQKKMWNELLEQKPSLIFLIGDNVYADKHIDGKFATPADLWKRYTDTRLKLQLYFHPQLIPTYATWDDHDYGINNGGKDYLYAKDSLEVFKSFFSLEANSWFQKGPGVSSLFRYAGQNFVFLDDRSFRDVDNGPGGNHLGKSQREWLWKQLRKFPRPTWLINGNQYFGAHHPFESFQRNHPDKFQSFLDQIKKLSYPVVFVSGDRHLTEIMRIPASFIGHQTYELTSSGMHSHVEAGSFKKFPNPYQIAGAEGEYNYMIIDALAASKKIQMNVQAFGPDKKVLYQKDLKVEKK
jgi:alkaline phosphatase D